jgi:hypothetical protein
MHDGKKFKVIATLAPGIWRVWSDADEELSSRSLPPAKSSPPATSIAAQRGQAVIKGRHS